MPEAIHQKTQSASPYWSHKGGGCEGSCPSLACDSVPVATAVKGKRVTYKHLSVLVNGWLATHSNDYLNSLSREMNPTFHLQMDTTQFLLSLLC